MTDFYRSSIDAIEVEILIRSHIIRATIYFIEALR